MSNLEVFIADDAIIEKAHRLQAELNSNLPQDKRTYLKFSNGWLEKFKKRNNFKAYRSLSEMRTLQLLVKNSQFCELFYPHSHQRSIQL